MNEVVVLGGGFAGMSSAYRLGLLNIPSLLIERSNQLGGLGTSSEIAGQPVECFYHFIKSEDKHMLEFIKNLGLGHRLRWTRTQMGFYIDERTYSLSSPMDLLRFKPFNWPDKFKFALGMLRTKYENSKNLEGISAKDWIMNQWGENIYYKMMEPLLQNKFAIKGDLISAAFLHNRIKAMLSTKSKVGGGDLLGYLHGSTQVLSDRLEEELRKTTQVSVKTHVQEINKTSDGFNIITDQGSFNSRYVVNTLPLTTFRDLKKNFEFKNRIDYQGAVCGMFLIKQPITKFFWLNILDNNILFKALVNQSILDDYPGTLVYCVNYIPTTDPLFQQSSEEIMGQYLNGLKILFGNIDVIESKFFKTAHATPIFDIDYREKMAELDESVPGMFFAGNAKIYPFNRVISNVMATGCQVAEQIALKLGKKDPENSRIDYEYFSCT